MTTTDDLPRTVNDLPDPEPGWRPQASCRIADPDLFVAQRDDNSSALAYCVHCPVVMACRVNAVRFDDQFTVRGGMTPHQRNGWLSDQGIPRPAYVAPEHGQLVAGGKVPVNMPRLLRLRSRGATFAEIARALGCTERTVQRRYTAWVEQQRGDS